MAVTLVTGDDGSNVRVGGPGDDLIYGFNPAGPQGNVTSIAATRVAAVPGGAVFAASPPGDTGRLFIGNLDGTVRILDLTTGQLLPNVFIDIGSSIGVIGDGGLIGFAFDPDYASNGYFYVNVTNPSDDTEIRRYQVSATDPNHADPASQSLLLRIDQPDGLSHHNGGWVEFGPDGYLYTAIGDGGDPTETGQNIDDLLGNILRLDIRGDDFPADPDRNYAVPADNPFVGATGADEIWAFGLRNPFRNGFDRGLGDLYIADVGQNSFEEIDFGQKGGNYGWDVFEGFMPFDAGPLTGGSAVDPIFAYGRSVGATVIGGYVYRGQSEGLHGEYFFADASNGKIFTLQNNGGSWSATERTAQITPDIGSITSPVSFGQDVLGNLYVVDLDGEIFRLTPIVVSADLGDDLDGGGGKDMLFGGSANDTLHGGSGNDSLYGGQGDDILTGGDDADFMFGDAGNDTYFVDQAGDVIFEHPNAGTDTVVASISFTLGTNFEHLVLAAGAGSINATGNAADNVITANSDDNTLNGGPGNDTLTGGPGADRFFFAQFSDRVDTITDFSSGQDLIVFDHNGFGFSGTGSLAEAGVPFFINFISGDLSVVYDTRIFEVRVMKAVGFHAGTLDYNGGLVARIDPGHTVAWAGSPDLGSRPAPWQVIGTGDFDHDGNTDILWRNSSTGQLDEWRMAGGQWAGSIDLGARSLDWQVVGIGDFNNDGISDVLWRNTLTNQLDEWVMVNGNWARSIELGSRGSDWQVAGVGSLDFVGMANNKESSDILWRNSTTGQLDGWLMSNGNWSRSIDLGSHGTDWQVAGIGSVSGHADYHDSSSFAFGSAGFINTRNTIVFRNPSTGQVDDWILNVPPSGSGPPTHQTINLGSHGTDWQIAGIGDFNASGQSDILWRNPTTGQMDGWVLRDGQYAGSMTFGSVDPAYQASGIGDFNGDGAVDVLWRNPSTGHTNEWTLVSTAPMHASDYFVV